VAALRGGYLTTFGTRGTWWAIAFIAGAIVGWLLSAVGGVFFGFVFFFPFGLGGDRVRAAIAGALTGASLTALAIHGLAPDLVTLAAGATLVVGLFATVQAFRRP
jgi:hypothetical protein